MTSETSVVTPERFATGISSFKEWMAAISQRQEEFQRHYDEYDPKPEDVEYFKRVVAERGIKALVIGEDWCPDVWRGVPVMAKLSERTGMEVRYFMRDLNKDIMAEFLNQGEFESVPTIVLYDGNHNYLGHFIERAKLANEDMPRVRAEAMPDPMPERDTPEHAAAMAAYREATIAAAGPWRHAQVEELREIIEGAR